MNHMTKDKHGIGTLAIVAVIVVIIVIIAGAYIMFTPPATPKPTIVTIGTTDKISDMDPANAYDFYTWEVLNNIAEGLMKYKPGTTELELGLAQAYNVSSDGLTYVFNLKPNLKFADGSNLTSADVKRSFDRVIDINGDPAWLVSDFVQSVDIINATAIQFNLKTPVSYFTVLLATPPSFPINSNYSLTTIDSDQTAGGAGPYRIANWTRDSQMVLEANPNYYNTSLPLTKTIAIKFYNDATTMRLDLEAGNIDIAWKSIRPIDLASLKNNANLTVMEAPGPFIRYIVINPIIAPFDNINIRQALAAALDRSSICSNIFLNSTVPLYTMIPSGMWSHTDTFRDKYGTVPNIALAKTLLEEAGYNSTNKLSIDLWYTPSHYGDTEASVALLIKTAWENTDYITVNLHTAEWSTYLSNWRTDVMSVSLGGWYPDYVDPDDYTTPFWSYPANHWLGHGYNDSAMIALLQGAQLKTTQDARAADYVTAQQISANHSVTIPIMQGELTIASKKNIGGIILDPTMTFRYYLVYWK